MLADPGYTQRRDTIRTYFDRTAVDAWKRFASDAPMGRVRTSVREGRARMRAEILSRFPADLQGWRISRPETGAGVVMDITVHDADTLRFVLQEDPESVTAMVQSAGLASGGLEDGVMGTIRFKSGLLAQFNDAFTVKFAGTGFEVHGSEGSLIGRNVMTQRTAGEVLYRHAGGEALLALDHENIYQRSVRAFMNAARGQGAPAATGEDGVHSLSVALAALESARTGSVARINPGL